MTGAGQSVAVEHALRLDDGTTVDGSAGQNLMVCKTRLSVCPQNMPLSFFEVSGMICRTSQCSTILPESSKRKMSMPA